MFSRTISVLCAIVFSVPSWGCGTERWDVKTLTDPNRNLINRNAVNTTIAQLIQGPAPVLHRNTPRIPNSPETSMLVVKAILLGYHAESDEDFHLVIADPQNPQITMIAEIPSSNCVQGQQFQAMVTQFRNQLIAKFGAPGRKTRRLRTPAPILLRGVGFFDLKHPTPQDGVAPNGIELHPILGMSLQ